MRSRSLIEVIFLAAVVLIIGRASIEGATTFGMICDILAGAWLFCIIEFVWIVSADWLFFPNR